jgi:hypothetical protein
VLHNITNRNFVTILFSHKYDMNLFQIKECWVQMLLNVIAAIIASRKTLMPISSSEIVSSP